MTQPLTRRRLMLASSALALAGPASSMAASAPMQDVLDYVQGQKTTGFLVIQRGRTLAEANWPVAPGAMAFRAFTYGATASGALLEDVASQQKSFVAMLTAIAVDKGLLDVNRTVSSYIGPGWSRASQAQEAAIRVIEVLTMSSGLTEQGQYSAPPGSVFLYNTPIYAFTKKVLAAAAGRSLEDITRDWLTAPAGMGDTSWRQRPAAFADVGNPTGLVTSPRDTARFGQIVLDGGKAAGGKRIVSQAQLSLLFARSAANPAYGRLWWLNGSRQTIRPLANRVDGPLIPAAPSDLVAALGALDRKLYVVPSLGLIVVRMGQAAPDKDFDQQLWVRLMKAVR